MVVESTLRIDNLCVLAGGKRILKDVSLAIKSGEIHALMGPNGSGKSTLAFALAGHPDYEITKGKISLGRKNLVGLKPEERAKAGLFLAFQHPIEVEGVSLFNFLRTVVASRGEKASVNEFFKRFKAVSSEVGLGKEFLRRDLNLNFSGGEGKRSEVFQALALRPRFTVFDETDSGLDVDALQLIAGKIKELVQDGSGVLMITHYQRILRHLKPDFVHVMVGGRIVESGRAELAEKVGKEGYTRYG